MTRRLAGLGVACGEDVKGAAGAVLTQCCMRVGLGGFERWLMPQ